MVTRCYTIVHSGESYQLTVETNQPYCQPYGESRGTVTVKISDSANHPTALYVTVVVSTKQPHKAESHRKAINRKRQRWERFGSVRFNSILTTVRKTNWLQFCGSLTEPVSHIGTKLNRLAAVPVKFSQRESHLLFCWDMKISVQYEKRGPGFLNDRNFV